MRMHTRRTSTSKQSTALMLQALRAGWRAPALSSTFRKPQHLVAPLPEGMAPKQSRYMPAEEKRLILMWHDDDDEDAAPDLRNMLHAQ